ncbi:MAG: L,D-transpeptidase [Acidobacteria bacterium]|nr:L,D-transpeptidase [Acidobacteriota bacterium]
MLEKLNRADADKLPGMGVIVVPDRWDFRELDYTPMPRESSWARAHRKAVIVHQQGQVFGAYENGKLVRWGPVSSGGKRRPTPSGYFHLNWKSKGRHSTVNRSWFLPWAFNFINQDGISFHRFELPGYPASHGCVRLLECDAKWLYTWGDQWQLGPRGWTVETPGTAVWIVGAYDYNGDRPWLQQDYLAYGGRISLGHQVTAKPEPTPVLTEPAPQLATTETAAKPTEPADSI